MHYSTMNAADKPLIHYICIKNFGFNENTTSPKKTLSVSRVNSDNFFSEWL